MTMTQMTSTIDYKALAERVAQRAIYADNNADRDNKTWAADLRAIVSLLNGMADAQPVAWRCEVRDLLTQAEQCLSTAVRFEQWAHDEPPSYLSAWDYEADHIAAEIRAMLSAAPAAPQAEPIDPHMIVADDRFPDEPAEPKVAASFYTEDAELIGTTSAPIKKVEVEDDGSIHVFIDHWPQPVPAGWKLVPVEPTPEMLSAVGMMDGYDWHAPGCSPDADHANWYSAMIAAAPAAPQAEPKPTPASGNDLNVYKEMATNYRNDAQAEPKREPLSDEQIGEEATNRQMTAACEDAFYDGVRWAEHSHGIGGSDAE